MYFISMFPIVWLSMERNESNVWVLNAIDLNMTFRHWKTRFKQRDKPFASSSVEFRLNNVFYIDWIIFVNTNENKWDIHSRTLWSAFLFSADVKYSVDNAYYLSNYIWRSKTNASMNISWWDLKEIKVINKGLTTIYR